LARSRKTKSKDDTSIGDGGPDDTLPWEAEDGLREDADGESADTTDGEVDLANEDVSAVSASKPDASGEPVPDEAEASPEGEHTVSEEGGPWGRDPSDEGMGDAPEIAETPSAEENNEHSATESAENAVADDGEHSEPHPGAAVTDTEFADAAENEPAGEPGASVAETAEPVLDRPATKLTQPPQRSGMGSVALLLAGGAVAALIGFFAARYLDDLAAQNAEGPTPTENAAALVDQSARLDSLQAGLAEVAARDIGGEIAAAVDPLKSELDSALTDTNGRLDTISGSLTELTERVETLAMRPVATGIDADAFDEALTEFRGDLNAAIEEANAAVADAKAEITAARSTAEQISDQAFQAEQASIARAAWSQVVAALDSGTPYVEPLAEARDALTEPVPEVVEMHAETGIPTLASLQEGFPDAARSALDSSIRAENSDGALDRLTAFIRVQSGARSLTPREGDDPDAILSRAEANVQSGELEAALAEIQALPEAGQAALSGWRDAAETRIAATSAAADLAQQLEQN
jgi:hypothetical protein